MHGNSGPAREVWKPGDRVRYIVRGADYGKCGTVTDETPPRASWQYAHVWVRFDDGLQCYCDPNLLGGE